MVKVMPNMALVQAKIRNIKNTEESNVFLADLDVLSSEPISGYQDFVSRFLGKTIEAKLLVKNEVLSKDVVIKLLVKYEGDEYGGSFYAKKAIDKL